MSSVTDALRTQLLSGPGYGRWCVAFSGGLDSTVLLDALSQLRAEADHLALRAVHVDHGLHPESGAWAAHCRAIADRLGVSLEVRRIDVDLSRGEGIEAAARRARYAEFESLLAPGETLATAHHQDDQAETVLLRLLRGAGVRGLGGIPAHSAFGAGWLSRPLLAFARAELQAYARSRGLTWIDDPTNLDTTRDRNFLRHDVMPVLRRRWHVAGAALGRSARLAAEAAALLDALGEQDLQDSAIDGRIDIEALRRLEPARQRNLVRHVLRQQGFPLPSETQLLSGMDQLLSAGEDRNPVWRWPGGQVRRYRRRLYLLEYDPEALGGKLPDVYHWDGHAPLELGPVRGLLRLERPERETRPGATLTVSFRQGGERLLEADRQHHKRLKKMFQAGGIVPWMREHVPLVSHGGRLIAVADLWASADLASCIGPASRIVWDRHAPIR